MSGASSWGGRCLRCHGQTESSDVVTETERFLRSTLKGNSMHEEEEIYGDEWSGALIDIQCLHDCNFFLWNYNKGRYVLVRFPIVFVSGYHPVQSP